MFSQDYINIHTQTNVISAQMPPENLRILGADAMLCVFSFCDI